MRTMKTKSVVLSGLLCLILSVSCSTMAINAVSNALSGTGSSDVFTSDTDPELVGDALPFAIKMYEALLAQNPKHQGLLLTTGSLFVMYANAFIQGPAEMLDPIDFYQERSDSFERAKKLYLRGTEKLYSALDIKYPGFSTATVQEGTLAPLLKKCKKEDVALLYWTAAGSFAAYSIDVFDFSLAYNIPEWGAMMARAYELDPNFNDGAIDEFYIQYYASLPDNMGGDMDKAETHFKSALEKSGGMSAGAYVSYAKAVCANAENPNYDAFIENLNKALEIDPDQNKSNRLVNIISQRKARFMLDNAYEFFSALP